jgi:citrate lyase subunit beta / citryl-CoA lyase
LGNSMDFTDMEAWELCVRDARAVGFMGSTCIHPAQIPALNRVFGVDETLVAGASKVIEAYSQSIAVGRASTSVDGIMIDIPSVRRARRVLRRAEAIRRKDALKQAHLS